MSNAYEVLGVPRTADQAAIRKAYLRASLRSHPDKNPGREEEAKAEFVRIGQAYEVLGDPAKRSAYDRDLAGKGRFRPGSGWQRQNQQQQQRPTTSPASTSNQQQQSTQQQQPFSKNDGDEDPFERFADLFDETVAGMSEDELNMAMGVAAAVGSIVGSIVGSRAAGGGKGGNSILSTLGSVVGSAVASQAASTLVKTVHEDSTQRALERKERDAAVARGESVPERKTTGNRERVFRDAGTAFQKMGASMGGGAASSNNRTNVHFNYSSGNRNNTGGADRTNNNDNYDVNSTSESNERSQFPWKEAAKLATMAIGACVEMQRESKASSNDARR
mmetsp:Transcript_8528/g.18445  ORF Transcript_8528/g.18445 Transcript_8528/m.18445 type:complete len:333 (+) Transcript_8528:201-1199(+)